MAKGEPFVSVLTPCHNAEPYLAECIESVLNQTHRNFEYIIVDNQSTDRSGDIAAEYSKRDSRIRLIRSDQFRTQIQNYNFALDLASPESRYIKFALADDWLFPRSISELTAVAEANPTVGIVSALELRGSAVYNAGLPVHSPVLPGRQAARIYFLDWLFLFGSPTTVLYRGDVIRSRTPFFENALHEDTEAVFYILAGHDFGFVHQVLCFIRTQDDSITGRLRKVSDDTDNSLDRVIIIARFGRTFLEPAEYQACRNAALTWYYDDLARRWWGEVLKGGPPAEFWAFHRRALADIGERIDRLRLVRAAVAMLGNQLLNPGHALRARRQTAKAAPPPTEGATALPRGR